MTEKFWRTPLFVLCCATCIVMISFGMRQTFGLYMQPISASLGWGREPLSFALAIQNLIIGLGAPFAGALADKIGTGRVLMAGGALYALGVFLMSQSTTPTEMLFSAGFLIGFGVSGCSLPMLLSIAGRVASEARRSLWLGIITTGGTAGQLLIVPLCQGLITNYDWVVAVIVMAAIAALIVPLAAALSVAAKTSLSAATQQTLGQAIREASGHSGYILLVVSFFVCGFQVQFIGSHLPAYITDRGLDAAIGATAVATIALFNLFGTWTSGWLGGRFRKKYLLSALYIARAAIVIAFISVPVTPTSVMVFAACMGFLWLSTVPLTSGIVAQMFGTRYMATLYGVVYLSHQIGSFSGVWLGGRLYDLTGDYTVMWWAAVALGILAALLNLPMDDRPVARMAAQKG
ncbi:MAG: MFS transporter [Alphaproteobacteria bacterium]|nr:MFS transporter [Alphaproteobacteria bacterium]